MERNCQTILDVYHAMVDLCGSSGTDRTYEEVRSEWHRREMSRYEVDAARFLDAVFADEWAYGGNEER